MSFVKSILFGSQGNYNVLGVKVSFENNFSFGGSFSNGLDLGPGFNASAAIRQPVGFFVVNFMSLAKSHTFRVLTLGYLHVFVHEMGHALAAKILFGNSPQVSVFRNPSPELGNTNNAGGRNYGSIGDSIVHAAGPMADMIFSSCTIIAAIAFRTFISTPVTVCLVIGSVIWMTGEMCYAYASATKLTIGDFFYIRDNGWGHLLVATTILTATFAYGIFAATKCL